MHWWHLLARKIKTAIDEGSSLQLCHGALISYIEGKTAAPILAGSFYLLYNSYRFT